MNDNHMEPVKSMPPIAISAITLLGIPLNEWVFILTIIYTVLQITFFVRDRMLKPWLHRRANAQKGKSQS
ncbi:phage holin family protein [Undibacterium umbellatum]|uniref:Uncharacterized protein n=1 Tax=Undibacterium umbellatum TaxID=2762300 RepID=A0ABR6Z7Z1_9BURK|nr:hypothetical protein [Undibacterium umbellatum]MBC3907888.1 hypothetical protein [Undibacterium umbellatum]